MLGMEASGAALSISGVGVKLRAGRWLFRDLSIDLGPGEIVRVIGASGSGVSTLLQVLAGVRTPSRGTVRRRAPSIGYVPQYFPESIQLSAEEYLAWIGRIRGMRPDVRERRITQLVRMFELGSSSTQRINTVPGFRAQLAQRVAIMQALLDEPSLLVLDNPWSSTDGHLRDVLAHQILDLAEAGCLVIYSGFAPAVKPTKYLSLTGGRLRSTEHNPDDEGEPHVRFELVASGPDFAGADFAGQVGVIAQHKHPRGGLVLTVERGHSDELLGKALRAGWSVRRVEPTE